MRIKDRLKYELFSLSKRLFCKENKVIKNLSEGLIDNISPEDLKINIDKSIYSENKITDNLFYYKNLLPNYYSLKNIGNSIDTLSNIKYLTYEKPVWYCHNKLKQKLPIAYPKVTDFFDKPVVIKNCKNLKTYFSIKSVHDGGKFNTLLKLDIYNQETNEIVYELNIIDNHNFYENTGEFLGTIRDNCITGIFDLYIDNNVQNKWRFFNNKDWKTIKVVNKDPTKNITTIDWLYLIQETLPKFGINIDEKLCIKSIDYGIEVYNISGIFEIKHFKNLKND